MNELAYLGLAVLVSSIGSLALWYRQRRPQSLESGVKDFSRGLQALRSSAPDEERRSA